MEVSEGREALRNAGLAIIAVGVVLAGLVYGRTFLVPLAISILVWNLLEAMIQRFASARLGSFQVPKWLAAILGIAVVLLGIYLVVSILLSQIDAVTLAWPRYVARLQTIDRCAGRRQASADFPQAHPPRAAPCPFLARFSRDASRRGLRDAATLIAVLCQGRQLGALRPIFSLGGVASSADQLLTIFRRVVTTKATTWLKSTSASRLSSPSVSSFLGLKKRR